MRPEEWQEIQEIYEQALALPEEEREAFLGVATAGENVRAEVRRLLRAGVPAKDFLEPPGREPLAAGQELGDFTLLEEIGRGGMGVVYRALQRPLARIVAVKVLPSGWALTQRQIDRFQREARAAARLSHPNLVAVLTVGEEGDVRFFVMEYVEGSNLADEIGRLRKELGAADERKAHLPSSRDSDYFRFIAESIRQVADGLAYAHAHGVIHRDVKPSNLLLDVSGRMKLVDFGLARDEEQGALSSTGVVMGTPHYMSPEQALAQRQTVDHRTDVYSLGVVLYELLTLRRPFEGNTSQEVITNLLQSDPPSIRKINPRVPRDLETICTTAMARDPRDRYHQASALRDDLERFLAHEAIEARPPSFIAILLRRAHRHRVAIALLGVTMLGAVLGRVLTQEMKRSSEIEADVGAISAALAEAPLRELPPHRQQELRQRLQRIRAQPGVLAAEAGDVVSGLEHQFATLKTELQERGRADSAFAKDAGQTESAREDRRLSGLITLTYATLLFPEDDELRRMASIESALPTIQVRAFDENGEVTPARVYLRQVDVLTSGIDPKRELGATPLPPTPILPGYYRVVVVFEKGGFRELICNPGPAFMESALVARRSADEADVTAGMVLIPATEYTFPDFEGERSLQGKTVRLEAYFVDEAETTNREYHRFLQATGTQPPRYWKYIEDMPAFLASHGDHPVTGMTWYDANAYAIWSGKRLLTAAEWQRAAGGPDNWPTPYSPDAQAPSRGNIQGPDPSLPEEIDYWSLYLEQAAPVRSHADSRSPEGLYHMYGNVAELTESMALVFASATDLTPRPFDRLFFGQAWHAHIRGVGMRVINYWGIGPSYTSTHIGFRCAHSQNP